MTSSKWNRSREKIIKLKTRVPCENRRRPLEPNRLCVNHYVENEQLHWRDCASLDSGWNHATKRCLFIPSSGISGTYDSLNLIFSLNYSSQKISLQWWLFVFILILSGPHILVNKTVVHHNNEVGPGFVYVILSGCVCVFYFCKIIRFCYSRTVSSIINRISNGKKNVRNHS